jgi:asparagine synthase (glutamine-hydrolysing)
VQSLPAGSLLRIRDGSVVMERWADPIDWTQREDDAGSVERLVEAVRDSVRAHLIADVPVAVFLSSGVDSGVIASIAAHEGSVTALTVRDPDADESTEAAARARSIGVAHEVIDVSTADAPMLAAAALDASDQPSVDGINSFVIAQAAAQAGFRVALSGVGGDELFGGYASASRLPALARAHRLLAPLDGLPAAALRRPSQVGWSRRSAVGRARWVAAHAGLAHGPYLVTRGVFAPAEVAALLDVDHTEVLRIADERLASIPIPPSHPAYASASEATQYLRHQLLRDIDATSMASSVEIRTPLVDARLLAVAAACPQQLRTRGPAKAVLRAAARHELPGLVGPKRGFTVPMARWVREGRVPLDAVTAGVTDAGAARRIAAEARSGDTHWSRGWLLQVLGTEASRDGSPGLPSPAGRGSGRT